MLWADMGENHKRNWFRILGCFISILTFVCKTDRKKEEIEHRIRHSIDCEFDFKNDVDFSDGRNELVQLR